MPENITITVDDTTETVDLFVSTNTVFGRALPVVAVAGDYDTDEVTEATNLYYTDARVAANSAVALNTAKVTFPEAPNDGTQYARKSLGWEAVAGGGDYADGGEAGGADRTLGNTDNFSLGFIVNNLKALLLKPIATAVNWLAISPSATGSDVLISSEGTDANIDIAIIPKGTGGTKITNDVVIDSGDLYLGTNRYIYGNSNVNLRYGSLFFTFRVGRSNVFNQTLDNGYSNDDAIFLFQSLSTSVIGSNLEMSFMKFKPTINQSGTAAYNAIKVDVTETATGDGTAGDGNNLLSLAVGGVSKARIDNTGAIFSSGTPAYADEAAAVTAGLATGDIYQTTGTAASPLNVAGILMIKQ